MDNGGSDSIIFFPLSPFQPLFLPQAATQGYLFHLLLWVYGFCGDRQRSTISGLRVLLDFRKFH
ncbi:hypothetical protein D8674_035347 [Pyrus ussuriensis x Pyrus communis]|uniref:Uncharacterized protein n=1 Tax=Pyrus ussuriensis x Pyrus communis TaxID=2448454 RepID=A0A5N5GGQ5_9ROSA|nr:hypothetical protein D8674_035347 [Pyrus ussuriensis x Pyrus communis]